jgi:Tfp pilus assembly protein PilV
LIERGINLFGGCGSGVGLILAIVLALVGFIAEEVRLRLELSETQQNLSQTKQMVERLRGDLNKLNLEMCVLHGGDINFGTLTCTGMKKDSEKTDQ